MAAAKAKTPTAPQPEFEEEDDDDLDDELDDYDDLMESSSEKTPTGAAAKSKKVRLFLSSKRCWHDELICFMLTF